jgi:hypothetical protein
MPPTIAKNNVVEVIERHQQDAFRKLRHAGVPEAQALLVMQRISSFCLQTLRELDLLYRQFEELVAEDGRSEPHQLWLLDKAGALLLQSEAGIAAIVAEAIRQATQDLKNQPPPPQQVIEPPVRARPAPPEWLLSLLATLRLLVWVAGLYPAVHLAWFFTLSDIWMWVGPLLLFGFWVRWGGSWWALILPGSAIAGGIMLYATRGF